MKKRWSGYLSLFLLLLLIGVVHKNVYAQEFGASEVSAPLGTTVIKKADPIFYNCLKLTWKRTQNASSYEIYRKEKGKWAMLGETTGTFFCHVSTEEHPIEPGIRYRYTVRAVRRLNGKKVREKQAASNTCYGKTVLEMVSGISLKAGKSQKIKISWNKVPGADRYQIYWKNAKGKWQLVAGVGEETTSYLHKSPAILPGTTYTYTVRAYADTSKGLIAGRPYKGGVSVTTPRKKFKKVIMIGDSRGMGMSESVTPTIPTEWHNKVAAGYNWMTGSVMPEIEGRLRPDTALVIMLGVNDVYQQTRYVSYMNSHVEAWNAKGVSVYYVAVGPVADDPYLTDAEVRAFNSYMKSHLKGIKFIDSYSYLAAHGYSSVDGTHYTESTYRKQYEHIMKSL